jgi:ABC-type transport system involved in multi-copper enzyme maturation permease subunit
MIWLSWRQSRVQVLVMLLAVAVVATVLALTGPDLAVLYRTAPANFLRAIGAEQIDRTLYLTGFAVLYAAPPLLGAFWGAPLIARELETGTHRLVWNQGITRSRWLAIKLAVVGLAVVAVAGLLSLAISWWSSSIDTAINAGYERDPFSFPRLLPVAFGARGVVPMGYAAFAFALGVTFGLLLRRSVPAMAVTLAVVVATQVAMPMAIRSHLIAPVTQKIEITAENFAGFQARGGPDTGPKVVDHLFVDTGGPGDWMLTNETLNAGGQVQVFLPLWVFDCRQGMPTEQQTPAARQACFTRLADEGYRQSVAYIPATSFWALQWREAGLLFALALLLVGFCFWRIRRDLT